MKEIPDGCFYGCSGLKNILIPNKVNIISNDALNNCSALQNIYGYVDSYAQAFAEEKGYNFIPLEYPIINSEVNVLENGNSYVFDVTVYTGIYEITTATDYTLTGNNDDVTSISKTGVLFVSPYETSDRVRVGISYNYNTIYRDISLHIINEYITLVGDLEAYVKLEDGNLYEPKELENQDSYYYYICLNDKGVYYIEDNDWPINIQHGEEIRVIADENRYSITYKLDGGVNDVDNPTCFSPMMKQIVIKDAEKSNCEFVGWYLDSNFNTPFEGDVSKQNSDLMLYAKWKEEYIDILDVIIPEIQVDVEEGDKIKESDLPNIITVIMADGTEREIPIIWDMSDVSYNDVDETQVIEVKGYLEVPDDLNIDDAYKTVTATIQVNVKLDEYKEEKEEATFVEGLISNIPDIGEISLDNQDIIVLAREAYNSLSEVAKTFVSEEYVKKLNAAEIKIKELNKSGDNHSDDLGDKLNNKTGNDSEEFGNSDVPQIGSVVIDKKYNYKVTKEGSKDKSVIGEVKLTGLKKKSLTTIKIARQVTIDGITYNVTSIAKNAFKNNKKIQKVIIGKNIKSIGTGAFVNCKKLKRVVINSKVLKRIGKKAFYRKKGKKITFKVPKVKKKSYKKLLKRAKTNKYKLK